MHRKEIKNLKMKAASAWQDGKKKEAHELWQQADKERKALQAKKKK